jgi:Domain of Unknown Function (DUF1080)
MGMRLAGRLAAILVLVLGGMMALAQENPFLGKWNITGQAPNTNHVYWLEVKEEGGKLSALFLNRGGSPVPVENIKLEKDQLMFTLRSRPGRPAPEVQLKAAGKGLAGTVKSGSEAVNVAGVRPPRWGSYDANAKHTLGKPVDLFNGKSLDAWTVQHKEKPMGWKIEDGVMTNESHANNLVSQEKFQDFRIQAEYKLEKGSNSGIYLRGRYELQLLDDAGKEPESHGHMAIYARKAPDVNASKQPAEWQSMEATLVGNRVTIVLNGKKVHDNAVIEGLTGGALDANELDPGPIMVQGDHERVWFRKVTVIPILDARKKSS